MNLGRARLARWFALPVLIALTVAGCAPPGNRASLDETIRDAVVKAGHRGTVDLAEVVDFPWQTMYAFGGYATDDQIHEATGGAWPAGEDSRIPDDGLGLVVFLDGQTIAAWAVLNLSDAPAGVVRFEATGVPVERDAARFIGYARDVTVGGDDLYYLRQLPAS